MKTMTLEQKIIRQLANRGYLTNVGDIARAMREPEYAEKLLTGNMGGIPDGDGECDHIALTNDEIQEVFDNDNQIN